VKCLIKEFPNKKIDITAKEAPDSEEECADCILRLQTLYILELKLFSNAPSVPVFLGSNCLDDGNRYMLPFTFRDQW
jgi:hypothetical protein